MVLTKIDGDARGGAALSVKEVVGKPILFAGTGEKLDDFEPFHPDRMASRILGMGDVLTLIEKAEATFDQDEMAKTRARSSARASFTLEDFLDQMRQVRKMGPLQNVLGMLPGRAQGAARTPRSTTASSAAIEAIICSMTPAERRDPSLINGSRRVRIAEGSGVTTQDVNALLKQFKMVQQMMKSAGKGKMPKLPMGELPASSCSRTRAGSPARGRVGYARPSHFAGRARRARIPRREGTPLRGREDPPHAGGQEEAAHVPRRRRRRPFAPRRPLHRDHRPVRAPARSRRSVEIDAESRAGLAAQGRPAHRAGAEAAHRARACGRSTRPSAASPRSPSSSRRGYATGKVAPPEKKVEGRAEGRSRRRGRGDAAAEAAPAAEAPAAEEAPGRRGRAGRGRPPPRDAGRGRRQRGRPSERRRPRRRRTRTTTSRTRSAPRATASSAPVRWPSPSTSPATSPTTPTRSRSTSRSARGEVALLVHANPDDMGRLIGKRGRVIQALRQLVRAAGTADGVKANVDIVE